MSQILFLAHRLPFPPDRGDKIRSHHVLKALAYFVMLRPWLYGIPARIPQLGLGRTEFTTDFPLALPDRVLMTAFGPGFTCAGLLLEAQREAA